MGYSEAVSDGNLEVTRRIFAAVAERDLELLLELTDPDVEWRSFFALGEAGGVYRGHDGLRRYVSDLNDAWEVIRPRLDDAVFTGDVALLVGTITYRGRESGTEAEEKVGWVVKFRNGRLLRFQAFRDPERAIEEAWLKS